MRGFQQQLVASLRLYFRNGMALVYGYAFPLIFLVAFYVLYRYERVPLARHMGELLTIAVLGGACFGLPTTLVSERERGVWRRYKLAPVPAGTLVASTMVARFLILVSAGLLQIGLAMAIGMPMPGHPGELLIAFTFVAFAFLGLGLVIATLADNVPAVQALGQCVFLPMLIIGGVAVPLASLPEWAQHLSAFFPGRYAVDAIQACVTGTGLAGSGFNLLALALIGAAGCLAGGKLFRWDAQQRFLAREGKAWVAAALAAWVMVGTLAESSGRVRIESPSAAADQTEGSATSPRPTAAAVPEATLVPTPTPPSAEPDTEMQTRPPEQTEARSPAPVPSPATADTPVSGPAGSNTQTEAVAGPNLPPDSASRPIPDPLAPSGPPKRWQDVTLAHVDQDLTFDRLPPDSGIVTPVAPMADEPTDDIWETLGIVYEQLPNWAPGQVDDPVQRARNLLYLPAVIDISQMPMESFVPLAVFAHLEQAVPKDDLIKVLYWIALHPNDGSDAAVYQMQPLGIDTVPGDLEETRNRAAIYGVKLLGRLLGRRPGR
jgi:ABC-2 type transport system permease protein